MQHSTGATFKLFQSLAHAAELLGMGIAANLHRQRQSKPVVVLPQIESTFHVKCHQLAAGFRTESGIRRVFWPAAGFVDRQLS